ncbi:MAG: response regulator transcription factor [Bacteroidales bacterium]|nr:response regulator transcription factor [Bacteroidales bacterium]
MIGPYYILLAEGDGETAMITKNYLASNGYPTIICENGREALRCFRSEKLNFLIINVSLAYIDGIEVAREVRKSNKDIPIIMFGRNVPQSDIAKCFQVDVDDFLAQPFSMEELRLRIQAIMRRVKMYLQSQHLLPLGRYTIDTMRHTLNINGNTHKLTNKEMDLLMLFYEYLGRVVERQVALKRIWNQENYFNARNMDVYIKKLRDMLCDDPNVRLENVHGLGYKLIVYNIG